MARRPRKTAGAKAGGTGSKEATTPPPEKDSYELSVDKLLAAANGASGPVRNAWLAFLGLLAYLLVTLAGVTHEDLLLNSPVTLPVVRVEIPLFGFFLAAPFLFLLVHLGLLVQHAMLAQKYQHFSRAVSASETEGARDHPDRRLVHNYVFSQMLAGQKPPLALHMLMRLMVFVTVTLLPIVVLLYFQIKFLPYHDVGVTHAHRIAILLDLVLLFTVRPFIAMPYLRQKGRKLRFGNESWRWELSWWSLGIAGSLSIVVFLFSLLVATVPQGCFWPFGKQPDDCFSLDRATADAWSERVGRIDSRRLVFAPTKWLFEGKPDTTSGTPQSLFSRNLIVTDKDLVTKKDFEEGEFSLPLRGRNLRFAILNRSDLRHADLFGSDLRSASARNARLEHARFVRAKMQGADLGRAQMQGANLFAAQMQGADLGRAQMQGAYLFRAEIWQVTPPTKAQVEDVDLTDIALARADPDALRKMLAALQNEHVRTRIEKRVAPLLDAGKAAAWDGSGAAQAWGRLRSAPKPAPAARAKILIDIACSDDTGGYVIKRIARRVQMYDRKGHAAKFIAAKKLIDKKTCPAAKHLSEEALARLRKMPAWEEKKGDDRAKSRE